MDPRHGIMQWCPRCPPSQERSRFDAYTIGTKTGWAGGKVRTDSNSSDDAFEDVSEGGVAEDLKVELHTL